MQSLVEQEHFPSLVLQMCHTINLNNWFGCSAVELIRRENVISLTAGLRTTDFPCLVHETRGGWQQLPHPQLEEPLLFAMMLVGLRLTLPAP